MWSWNSWQVFAVGSALFAGLTAVLAKVGVENVGSNFATFIRTCIILLMTAIILSVRGEWQSPSSLPAKSVTFLVLSGVATGLSWLCYYRALQMAPASQVAPIDKLSVAVAIALAVIFLGEKLTPQVALGGGLVVAGAVILARAG
jgi:transporter family protein